MGVLTVKTPPTVEPISLKEAKDHLAITFDDHDAMVQGQIRAARRNLEWKYDRAFLTQTLVLTLDRFDQSKWISESFYGVSPSTWAMGLGVTWSMIELRPPVQSITSITYLDPSGATQTLASANYTLDPGSEGSEARVYPALNKIWPVVALAPAAIRIEFVAGFASPGLVPDDWKAALLLYLGHLYANREQVVADARVVAVSLPMGVDALMGGYGQVLMR
jgi:hypothetical protein